MARKDPMQRQAALRGKAFGDVRGAGVRRSATAGQFLMAGVRKARKAHKRATSHRVKPFRWHV